MRVVDDRGVHCIFKPYIMSRWLCIKRTSLPWCAGASSFRFLCVHFGIRTRSCRTESMSALQRASPDKTQPPDPCVIRGITRPVLATYRR